MKFVSLFASDKFTSRDGCKIEVLAPKYIYTNYKDRYFRDLDLNSILTSDVFDKYNHLLRKL